MMLTIRLHLERPEAMPNINDAVRRLQKTPEYRYCTARPEKSRHPARS